MKFILKNRMKGLAAGFVMGAAIVVVLPAVGAAAQELQLSLGQGTVRNASLRPGTTLTVLTNLPYSDLVIARTDIADVVPLNDRSFYIQGNKAGITNVSIFNENKELLGIIDVRVRQDFSDVSAAVRAAVPGGDVRVSNSNENIRLSGTVASATEQARALQAAEQFAGNGTKVINSIAVADAQQVSLEVRIIEASRRAGRDLGIKWRVQGGTSLLGTGTGLSVNANNSGQPQTFLSNAQDGSRLLNNGVPFGTLVAQVLEGAGVKVDVIIDALEQKGLARRLAQPNLTTVSGEAAKFNVGGEVPVPSEVGLGGSITYKYRPYGVMLEFLPTVLDRSKINIRLRSEVSEIDRSLNVNGFPAFTSRTAESVLELRDGQSFAMAGMLQAVNERDVEQLPWLGQLPVLGALFRSTSYQKRQTDLVIVVTPHLVRPAEPGEKLHTPLDNTRPSNDVELFALGMLEVDKDMIRGFRDGVGIKGPYGHLIDLDFRDGVVSKK
ncbi:MAG: type II and III secretion system protein family protein [Mesorhizobium sp.]